MGISKLWVSVGAVLFSSLALSSTMEFHFDFPPPTIESKDGYESVRIPGIFTTGDAGEPILPTAKASILLPPGESIKKIEVVPGEKVFISGGYTLEHAQPQIPLSYRAEFEPIPPDSAIYNSTLPYPGMLWESLPTHRLCGYAIAHVLLYPVEWLPKFGVLSYYPSMKLLVTTGPSPDGMEATSRLLRHSESVLQRVRDLVDNPGEMDAYRSVTSHPPGTPQLVQLTDSCQYLIITSDSLASTFQALADFKTRRGVPTRIVTVEEIYATSPGADEQEKIRNLIIDAYMNCGIEWVLLGGDTEIIPERGFYDVVNEHLPDSSMWFEDEDIASDLYYAALDGDWNDDGDGRWGEEGEEDLYAEVFIGRMAVSSDSEAVHIIDKTIAYESSPVSGDCTEALMVGETLGWAVWGADYKDEIKDGASSWGYVTEGFPPHFHVATLYDRDLDPSSWNKEDLIPLLNGGVHLVNGMGHGNVRTVLKLTSSDVDTRFTNDGISDGYFIICSQACYANSFDNRDEDGDYPDDAIAEYFTRIPNGAVSFVGNTRYGWGNFICTNGASQRYDRQFFDALFGEDFHKLGEILQDSKEDNAHLMGTDAMRWCYYELSILGDPELSIWTEVPSAPDVAFPDTIFTGVVDFNVSVEEGGSPAEGALVCLSKDSTIYETGFTDPSGEVDFSIAPTDTGRLHVSVVSRNMLPYEGDAFIFQGSARVHFYAFEIDDDNSGGSSGNDDGSPNPAETIELPLWVKNFGGDLAEGTWGRIESADPWADVLVDSQYFGSIPQFDSALSSAPYRFRILDGCPDRHPIQFDLTVTDTFDTTWVSSFQVEVNAPDFDLDDYTIDDTTALMPNGVLDPGETAEFIVILENGGSGIALGLEAVITTSDTFITITDSTAAFGDVRPDSVCDNSQQPFIVSADPATPIHHIAEFVLHLTSSGYTDSLTFRTKIALGGDFLVWDPDPDSSSGPLIVEALEEGSYVGDYTRDLGEHRGHLSEYAVIFISLGMFPDAYDLIAGEDVDSLCCYLNQGGNLYLEGGDFWHGQESPLHSYFRFLVQADGDEDLQTLIGHDNTFTHGMSFDYDGERQSTDRIAPRGGGWSIFSNSYPSYSCGLAFRSGCHNAVGTSFEFGGLVDGVSPNDRASLADSLMQWFTREMVHDVAIWSYDYPGILAPPDSLVNPLATVKNLGSTAEGFYVSCRIESSGVFFYSDSQFVSSLAPDSSYQVVFKQWSPKGEGVTYSLTLACESDQDQESGNDSYTSRVVSFTPEIIAQSSYAAPPLIDGTIDTRLEWAAATRIDASDVLMRNEATVYPPGSVYLYVMNDHRYLYLGIDARCDSAYDYMDGFTVYTDDNDDGVFPPCPDSSEGGTTMWYYIQDWVGYRPICADSSLGYYPIPLDRASGIASGHLQYELAIPFGSTPEGLNASPGDTIGFGLIAGRLSFGSDSYTTSYGWWPQEAMAVDDPVEMGALILGVWTGVTDDVIDPSRLFQLGQAFPNPTQGQAEIAYELPWECTMTLKVYNSSGQLVKTLAEGEHGAGASSISWDCTDSSGKEVATGIYFYRLTIDEPSLEITRKLVVIR